MPRYMHACATRGSHFGSMGDRPQASGTAVRGGRLQRKRKLEELSAEDAPARVLDSELARSLVKKWAWGMCSATECQDIALCGYNDLKAVLVSADQPESFIPNSIYHLASLGTWGKHHGNISKEMIAWLGEPKYPPARKFELKVKVPRPRGTIVTIRSVSVGMLDIHSTFSHLFRNDRATFDYKFLGHGGSQETLHKFWSEVIRRKDPRLQGHPMCGRPDWTRKAIPFALHGDAVPVIRIGKPGSESLECISVQSLLASGPTLKIKLLMYAMFEGSKVKSQPGIEASMDTVWKNLCWTLRALFDGVFPAHDWTGSPCDHRSAEGVLAGTPLCSLDEPYFGVLWSVKGDLDWYFKGLGLKSYNSVAPCEFCPCDRTKPKALWPTSFHATAEWKRKLHTSVEWRESQEDLHILFQQLPYLSQHNLEADELHILHLGVLQYYLGSILWLLVYECMAGTPQENMDKIWAAVLVEYSKFPGGTEYSKLGLSSFTNPANHDKQYPRLKGRGCEVKSLLLPLQAVWLRYKKNGAFYTVVSESFDAITQVQYIIDEFKADLFAPDTEAAKCLAQANQFLLTYCRLATMSDRRMLMLFSAVPKLHWVWHMAHRGLYLSIRRGATFVDEDFVKHMKKIGSKCISGTPMHDVPFSLVTKYRWGLSVEVL
eukprot:6480016-Pyramimonas_sp.AAC.1